MNIRRISTVTFIIVLVVIILASVLYWQTAVFAAGQTARGPAGTWKVSIEPEGMPPFVNYSSMTKDGRIINSNQIGLTSLGEWERDGDHQFISTFWGFEESNGQIIRYVVQSTVELGKDNETFSGPFTTTVYDSEDNLLFQMVGTVYATRLHAEPPD